MCGLLLTVEDGAVTAVAGDPADPLSRGFLCPKAFALPDLHTDPDRLRRPVRRVGGGWEELTWDAAFDLVAERLQAIQRDHGAGAVAVYQGNPTVHSLDAMLFSPGLVRALRTPNTYSATSVDQLPHHVLGWAMYGHKMLLPIPDIDRTDFLLMLGSNPAASNGSLMTCPDFKQRCKDLTWRGGRFVLVDPRRTETARFGEHVFVRPGTDALLLASLVRVLFDEDLLALGTIEAFADGLDEVGAALVGLEPEATAATTGVPAEAVRQLARDFAAAESAVCHGRMGVSTQEFGGLCQWLCQLLNALTGNLDRAGGAMLTTPAVDIVAETSPGRRDRWRSRVRGLPEFGGELPVSALAEEMDTPGEGQIRALITMAGNPVLSTPDGSRLERALEGLDFQVAVDPYINETTRHADVILPPATPLERDHYDLAFNVLAVRNVARFSPAIFDKPADARHEWEIFAELTARLAPSGLGGAVARRMARAAGPRGLLAIALRRGPHGRFGPGGRVSLSSLQASPSGIDLGPLEPRMPAVLPSGRVQLAPALALADLPRLRARLAEPSPPLVVIGRRDLRSNNSWMHNSRRLMGGKNRCTLLVHPDDAAAHGLADGGRATVGSAVGSVEAEVAVTDEVMPGVVCLPHGWGHGRPGVKLSVATEHPGVSLNDLTDPARLDAMTGNAVLNGVPVTLAPA